MNLDNRILVVQTISHASKAECKKAILYAEEHDNCSAIGYLKAISCAVSTPKMSFDERVKYFSKHSDII